MAIKTLKTGKCANCGNNTTYFQIEDIDNLLTLSNYNLFKNPTINVCSHCGYVNDNLENDNIIKNTISQNKNLQNSNLMSSLKEKISIANVFLNNVPNFELKLRTLAYIFENNKLIYNVFLRDNYTKRDESTISIIREIKSNLKNSCLEILNLIADYKNENNFVNFLKIEVLSCLDETIQANKIFDKIKNNLPYDLLDYLEECLEIGGLV